MPASTSSMQVTRVHGGKKGDTQVCSPLSIGTLWYLRGINYHSVGLSTQYDYYHAFHQPVHYLQKGHATIGSVTRINVCFTEFYELIIKLLRKTDLF